MTKRTRKPAKPVAEPTETVTEEPTPEITEPVPTETTEPPTPDHGALVLSREEVPLLTDGQCFSIMEAHGVVLDAGTDSATLHEAVLRTVFMNEDQLAAELDLPEVSMRREAMDQLKAALEGKDRANLAAIVNPCRDGIDGSIVETPGHQTLVTFDYGNIENSRKVIVADLVLLGIPSSHITVL
jgi:hypothetical protein